MTWCFNVWYILYVLQVRGHSLAPGPTARRNLLARTSWPVTCALTLVRSASSARFVPNDSCAVTTWSSMHAATPTSSRPWSGAGATARPRVKGHLSVHSLSKPAASISQTKPVKHLFLHVSHLSERQVLFKVFTSFKSRRFVFLQVRLWGWFASTPESWCNCIIQLVMPSLLQEFHVL